MNYQFVSKVSERRALYKDAVEYIKVHASTTHWMPRGYRPKAEASSVSLLHCTAISQFNG